MEIEVSNSLFTVVNDRFLKIVYRIGRTLLERSKINEDPISRSNTGGGHYLFFKISFFRMDITLSLLFYYLLKCLNKMNNLKLAFLLPFVTFK